jgi:hypothetical protein
MLVSARDVEIIHLIARFNMLSSGHVNELLFQANTTNVPCNRVLGRLAKNKYLATIEKRMVGGTGGGSGQVCYQLGSKGWALVRREGRYWPFRSVNYHSLAIADAYVKLVRAEREGDIEIAGLSTEPDSWLTIAGADLRPDLLIEVAIPAKEMNVTLWLEVDQGTERQKQLKEKLARYWHAYQHATEADMKVFPVILFLVPDDERVKEINWLINSGPDEAKPLFRVQTQESFPQLLLS